MFCLFFSVLFFSFLFLTGAIFELSLCLTLGSRHYLHALPLPCCRAQVSPGGELPYLSGAPVFTSGDLVLAAAAQGMFLDCLVLEAGHLHSWDP